MAEKGKKRRPKTFVDKLAAQAGPLGQGSRELLRVYMSEKTWAEKAVESMTDDEVRFWLNRLQTW